MTFAHASFAQNNKELAYGKGAKAIEMMDNGKIAESIPLLEEAQKLDPESIVYPYEIAYAHYQMENYKGAIKVLETLTKHKQVYDLVFQLLGNSYDMDGSPEKAIASYEAGLKKFPNSGKLYLELGNMKMAKDEYGAALSYYEAGIKVEPTYPSNYYRATLLYCNSSEEVWGMIYGEIFMNLERNSKRTAEISKLLYDTYKSEIKFNNDTSFSVSFSKMNTIAVDKKGSLKNTKMPFPVFVYEPELLMAVIPYKRIDINTLDKIRTKFVENYFEHQRVKDYPNVLFTYQKEVLDAGQLEAYNHWILMMGDEEGFVKWRNENSERWESFRKWFSKNQLKITNTNRFYRAQYN